MTNLWEQPSMQMQKKESENAEKNLKLEINEKQEIFDKAEIMFKVSKDDERMVLEKEKYPEDLVVRGFANIREMLKNFLKIMTVDGVVDWKKYGEERRMIDSADPSERYQKEKALKNSASVRKRWSVEEALASITQEVKDITEHGFLGISVDERNIGQILKQGVYRGANFGNRRTKEELLVLSGANKDSIVTYGQIVDDRKLEKSKTHGHIILKLNPSVEDRTMFFVGDSDSAYGFPEFLKQQVEDLGVVDSASKRQILPEHTALGKAILNLGTEHQYLGQEYRSTREETYLECDINGSVDLASDVDEMLLDEDILYQMDKEDKKMFEQRFRDKIRTAKK